MPLIKKEQFNVLSANLTSYTYTVAAGTTSTTLPMGFEASTVTQVSGGDPAGPTRGIVTSPPDNYVTIKNSDTGLSLSDSTDYIFGRLTYSAPNYIVTYYKLIAGVETSATLPGMGSYDVTILFPEVMEFGEVPANTSVINVTAAPVPTGGSGAQGPQGPQGFQGDAGGPQGFQGDAGAQGFQGDMGPQGPQGDMGPQGFQGDMGPQGFQGDVGSQGPQGDMGPQGPQGDAGAQGPQGDVGPQGFQGDTGPQGTQGNANVSIGAFASRPTMSLTAGTIYYANDSIIPQWVYSGSVWYGVFGTGLMVPQIRKSSDFTLHGGGGSESLSDNNGTSLLETSNSGNNNTLYYDDNDVVTSVDFTATIAFQSLWIYDASGPGETGIALYNNADGKLAVFSVHDTANGGPLNLRVKYWNSITTPASTPSNVAAGDKVINMGPIWLQIQHSGADRTYRYSTNGITFAKFYEETTTSHVTPKRIGIFHSATNGTRFLSNILSYQVKI